MLSIGAIISTIKPGTVPGLRLPSRPFQGLLELLSGDAAFCDGLAAGQHYGDAPVVQAKEFVVGVDIGELRLDTELAEEGEGLIAEVAVLPGDQDDLHGVELTAGD
jgi:hypothetical protein